MKKRLWEASKEEEEEDSICDNDIDQEEHDINSLIFSTQ